MKQKKIFIRQPLTNWNQHGFTMMEFLVASILGLIVILAVGATYTATSSLNQRGEERLAIQQDIRSSTTMIMRDAHMAGNFGCLSLASRGYTATNGTPVNVSDGSTIAAAYRIGNDGYGVRGVATVPVAGFTLAAGTQALLFQYGIGAATLNSLAVNNTNRTITLATFTANRQSQAELLRTASTAGGLLALASCNRVDILTSAGTAGGTVVGQNINVGAGLPIGAQIDPAQNTLKNFHSANNLEVMRYVIHIYAVGTFGGQTGLYRIALGNNGTWNPPQLLSPDVTNIQFRFGYSNPVNCSDNTEGNKENFTFANAVVNGFPPSLLWVQLNVAGAAGAQVDGTTRTSVYQTTATIRGGNVCASRSLQKPTP